MLSELVEGERRDDVGILMLLEFESQRQSIGSVVGPVRMWEHHTYTGFWEWGSEEGSEDLRQRRTEGLILLRLYQNLSNALPLL